MQVKLVCFVINSSVNNHDMFRLASSTLNVKPASIVGKLEFWCGGPVLHHLKARQGQEHRGRVSSGSVPKGYLSSQPWYDVIQ